MEEKRVQAGKDTILRIVDSASTIEAVAELVWNALDAEATRVEVTVGLDEWGNPDEITVSDNGSGMTYAKAAEVFVIHGESWKKADRFSPNLRRPMHGKLGRGRFLAYTIGVRARWTTTTGGESENLRVTIDGDRDQPSRFTFDGPRPTSDPIGTTVVITARQESKLSRLVADDFVEELTARLGPTLRGLPAVEVRYRNQRLDPEALVLADVDVPLDVDPAELHGRAAPVLNVIEWDMKRYKTREMLLCDEHGVVVTDVALTRVPPLPAAWTAYLKWDGFGEPELMSGADLHVPEMKHPKLIEIAKKALEEHLSRRLEEQRGSIIGEWKAEGVYPYSGDPDTVVDELERDLFDIVAVVASPGIGKSSREKKLSLALLQETVRFEPTRVRRLIGKVLELDDETKEILEGLLERTQLSAIVKAARTVADRGDFLRGLTQVLYSDATRRTFNEVRMLHPLLVREPWVFGDEWMFALTESALTTVLREFLHRLGPEDEVALSSEPVVLSGGDRRVDMVFHCDLPESDAHRHLVVELKRPMRLTLAEYAQIANYAAAITKHPLVANAPHKWDFWLVGTDVDDAMSDRIRKPGYEGEQFENYRIWVTTWADLLDRSERRLTAFQEALDLTPTDVSGRAYLIEKHSELIPSALLELGSE